MGYYSTIDYTDLKITFPYEIEPEPEELDATVAAFKEQAKAYGLKLVDAETIHANDTNTVAIQFYKKLSNYQDETYSNLNYALGCNLEDNILTFDCKHESGKLYDLEADLHKLASDVVAAGGHIEGSLHRSGEEPGDFERYYFVDNKLKTEGVDMVWANSRLPFKP
jgi:hypothetical protein